jgi:uncharacterized membrane protein
MGTVDEITKLKELLDQGAITQEEFELQKAKIFAAEQAGQPGSGSAQQQYQSQQQYQQQYQQTPPPYGAQGGYAGNAHVPGTPYTSYQEDVQANKIFGILAYIGFLCFVSAFAAPKESRYTRFHANQGIVLFIFEVAGFIILNILGAAASASAILTLGAMTGVAVLVGIIGWAYWICMIILAILGIVNAINGTEKNLPVIGGIQILK